MKKPKLIFLNGFAGCGKSTLTQKYLDEHPFALGFEGDNLIVMFGQWESDWEKSSKLKLVHTRSIVETHLNLGYDVVLPFLLQDSVHADEYARLAVECEVTFYEFYLDLPREEAIARLLKRGSWGEPGSPPFTDEDKPDIEDLFEKMHTATETRENVIRIHPKLGCIEETYQELLSFLN